MNGTTAAFSEVMALLRRQEGEERHAADVEIDMARLLLMARDTKQRDDMVQGQAVRRIAIIGKTATSIITQRYCIGILGNLAHSERARLSASSCDRWDCVSYRHNCPLFMLLSNAQTSPDSDLQRLSAAALLAYSIQNECQLQIDNISGIPVLLRLLDAEDGDVVAYAAGTLWNMCKSPLLLLKLETIHGILKHNLSRKLTDILWTPLEPFHLAVRPTGERGTAGIIDSDGENLSLLITTSISTQLTIVLHIENYVGQPRALTDHYSTTKFSKRTNKGNQQQGKSVAHYDESGVLASRTCAVCNKSIRVTKKSMRGKFLLCAKESCGQAYHIKCSRWARLEEENIHPEHFHCDTCMLLQPLYYWDFVVEHENHRMLLTENIFRSITITRINNSPQSPDTTVPAYTTSTEDNSLSPYSMFFDSSNRLLGVGKKHFRIPPNSKNAEMFITSITFVVNNVYPATHQQQPRRAMKPLGTTISHSSSRSDPDPMTTNSSPTMQWTISYACDGALSIPFAAGNVVFWPGQYIIEIQPLLYAERTLAELEGAYLYELQGKEPWEKLFSFGSANHALSHSENDINTSNTAPLGLWTTLSTRKGVCMKLLAEQIGRQKQLVNANMSNGPITSRPQLTSSTSVHEIKHAKKAVKPHFPGKKLSRVAIES